MIIRFATPDGRITINGDTPGGPPGECVDYVLRVQGNGSTIQDLAIVNYRRYGIWLDGGANNMVVDTYLGLDADGNAPRQDCMGMVGIFIDVRMDVPTDPVIESSTNTIGGVTGVAPGSRPGTSSAVTRSPASRSPAASATG